METWCTSGPRKIRGPRPEYMSRIRALRARIGVCKESRTDGTDGQKHSLEQPFGSLIAEYQTSFQIHALFTITITKRWSTYHLNTQITTPRTFFLLQSSLINTITYYGNGLTNCSSTQNRCFLDAAACCGDFRALIPRITSNITHFALPTPLMMIAPG